MVVTERWRSFHALVVAVGFLPGTVQVVHLVVWAAALIRYAQKISAVQEIPHK